MSVMIFLDGVQKIFKISLNSNYSFRKDYPLFRIYIQLIGRGEKKESDAWKAHDEPGCPYSIIHIIEP